MNRLHTLSSIVFAIALAVYGYMQWQKSNEPKITPTQNPNTPEYIASKLTSSQFDSDGNLSHTIFAEQMIHFADKNETHFKTPKYTIYPDDNKPSWNISANEGVLIDDDELILTQRVRLRSSDKNSFISEIHGQELKLDLNKKIITSKQTILLKGTDFTMYGSGLKVDINTTEMTISEHVQTIYKKYAS